MRLRGACCEAGFTDGAESVVSGAQIAIRNDENCKVLCRIEALTENQAKAFRGKIEDEYRVLMCGPVKPLFYFTSGAGALH